MSNAAKWTAALPVYEALVSIYGAGWFVLAGGAPRDLLTHRPIGDFDYYILDSNSVRMGRLENILKQGGLERVSVNNTYQFTTSVYKDSVNMYNFIVAPVYKSAYEVVSAFDVGLCKVWYNPHTGHIQRTDEFQYDYNNKFLTFNVMKMKLNTPKSIDPTYSIGRALTHHIPKLKKKYPEYKLRVIT